MSPWVELRGEFDQLIVAESSVHCGVTVPSGDRDGQVKP
jgi:hypothetical protein